MILTAGEEKLKAFRAREKPRAVTARINFGIPRSMRFWKIGSQSGVIRHLTGIGVFLLSGCPIVRSASEVKKYCVIPTKIQHSPNSPIQTPVIPIEEDFAVNRKMNFLRYRDPEYRVFLRDQRHYQGRWHEPEERRERR